MVSPLFLLHDVSRIVNGGETNYIMATTGCYLSLFNIFANLLNILLVPAPLQMAVKIAAHTSRIKLVTSVCQLPLRDMRVFAGEAVQAQALCDGRLMLGVGKGAFGFETLRFDEFVRVP